MRQGMKGMRDGMKSIKKEKEMNEMLAKHGDDFENGTLTRQQVKKLTSEKYKEYYTKLIKKKYNKNLVFTHGSYDMCGHCLASLVDESGYISDTQLRYIGGFDKTFGELECGLSEDEKAELDELKRIIDGKT